METTKLVRVVCVRVDASGREHEVTVSIEGDCGWQQYGAPREVLCDNVELAELIAHHATEEADARPEAR